MIKNKEQGICNYCISKKENHNVLNQDEIKYLNEVIL